jgi:DMSO/TMAO reductase YedYZ heme-binding membrane subunit
MFEGISFYLIGGIPFIVYLGIVVFILFFITGLLMMLRRRGKTKISAKWHFRLAYLALVLGGIHLILGVFAYI